MHQIQLGKSGLIVPQIVIGCMRLNQLDEGRAEEYIQSCLEAGATFFDHADIYGGGACEELFAKAIHMDARVREKIVLQSKCGIHDDVGYDFSKEYILSSVDGILKRLKTEYLDILLLHRPDALADPEEVAEAFNILHNSGKVRHFGVSNHNSMQIRLLQKYIQQPLVVNQMQLSITNATMITQGTHVNTADSSAIDRDGNVLDFCRLNDITMQAWSPLQYGFFEGVFLGSEKYPQLNQEIEMLSEKYGVSGAAIAIAWILRHPANMQPVIGTTNIRHMQECIKAVEITLTRKEWYKLYLAAGYTLP